MSEDILFANAVAKLFSLLSGTNTAVWLIFVAILMLIAIALDIKSWLKRISGQLDALNTTAVGTHVQTTKTARILQEVYQIKFRGEEKGMFE